MQITLNSNEVSEAIREHVQSMMNLDSATNVNVEVNEDGSITVFVDEDQESSETSGPTPTGEKPVRKTRRTKAQIEADNKAEADRLAQAQLDASASTGSATAGVTDPVSTGTTAGEAGVSETVNTNTATGTVAPEVPVETGTEAAEDLGTDTLGGVNGGVGSDAAPGQNDQPYVAETEASQSVEDTGAAVVDNTNLATNAQETQAEAGEPTKARSLFANLKNPRNNV